MNVTTMILYTRRVILDANQDFITDAEIIDQLNLAQLDLASRLQNGENSASSTTSGSTIALPSDYLALRSLRLGTDDDVEFVSEENWETWSQSGEPTNHTLGFITAGYIHLYPTPTTGTAYRLRYYAEPTALAEGSDVPQVLPHLHSKMVDYARAYCKLKDNDPATAAEYMARYESGLPEGSGVMLTTVPGRLSVTPVLGPWDTPDARHW